MDVCKLRRELGLNQQQFWSAVGVTQSGGSRYESGRRMPRPVQALVNAVYVHRIDLALLTEGNAPLVRAVLAGQLDDKALQHTAELARELMASAGQLGVKAVDLSAQVRAVKAEEVGR